jgi:hypothetical protein
LVAVAVVLLPLVEMRIVGIAQAAQAVMVQHFHLIAQLMLAVAVDARIVMVFLLQLHLAVQAVAVLVVTTLAHQRSLELMA